MSRPAIPTRDNLSGAEDMHRLLFLSARDAILWADAKTGLMIDCNPAGERLLGRPRHEIVGMHQSELHPKQDAEYYRDRFADAVRSTTTTPTEAEILRPDGTVVQVEISTSSVETADGAIVQGIFRDIRQRKAAQAEIDRHRRRLSELTAELAQSAELERHRVAVELHERLGQELAAMKMLGQSLVARCDSGGSDMLRLLGAVDRCLATVRDLTDELSPTVLYELGLASALSWLVEADLERFGLRCVLQLDPALEGLRSGRATLAYRIVRELLMNVHLHAGVDCARVRVTLLDDTIVLNVDDDGTGFDPLTSGFERRSGFGLFSIGEEVRLSGGTVEIDSGRGRGTRIDIRIPLESAEGEWD